MIQDDPRHGTVAGYNRIPCRDECCRRAMANYKKRWTWDAMNGRARIVSAVGTRRRIEALMALGWSGHIIGQRLGMSGNNVTRLRQADTLTSSMASRVANLYDELSMSLPTGRTQAIANVRNLARRRGYLPPLAWDDVDNDAAPARTHPSEHAWDRVDEVVVRRLLDGQHVESCTRAEKEEALRRWSALGNSKRSLEVMHGWHQGRYRGAA